MSQARSSESPAGATRAGAATSTPRPAPEGRAALRSRAHEPRSRSTAPSTRSSARPPTRPGATRPCRTSSSPSRAAGSSPISSSRTTWRPRSPTSSPRGAQSRRQARLILWQRSSAPASTPTVSPPFSSSCRARPPRPPSWPSATTTRSRRPRRHQGPHTPGRVRHALEPRHESFDTAEARAFIAEHDICTVVADSAGRWPQMHDATSDFRYVRLHGETELYASGYTDESPTAGPPRSGAGSPTDTTPTSTSTTTPRATPLTTPSPLLARLTASPATDDHEPSHESHRA